EYPFPPVAPFDARTGFITPDDFALRNCLRDLVGLWLGSFPTASQDCVDAAFAQFDSEKISNRLDDSLITQMLLLLQINDHRFQAWSELASRLQTFGWRSALESMTSWALDLVDLSFDYDRTQDRQLFNLMANNTIGIKGLQIGVTIFALFDFGFDYTIRILDQPPSRCLVTWLCANPLLRFLLARIGLLIARRWLRRVTRCGGWFPRGGFRFQFSDARFQLLDFRKQQLDHCDQLFA